MIEQWKPTTRGGHHVRNVRRHGGDRSPFGWIGEVCFNLGQPLSEDPFDWQYHVWHSNGSYYGHQGPKSELDLVAINEGAAIMSMTAEQILKSAILDQVAEWIKDDGDTNLVLEGPFDTQEKISAAFEAIEDHGLDDEVSEAEAELRGSYTHETGFQGMYSRHYEYKSVARQFGDKWVGWTFWYGGEKHGEPESVEWMEDAYFVEAKEETRVVLTFTKQENEGEQS